MVPDAVAVVLRALDGAGVQYVVVGGVAVVLHGYLRFTADMDLVVALSPDNARAAVETLAAIGYHPNAPVPPGQFADQETREAWVREKEMLVFSFWNSRFPQVNVDLFVREPFPFDEMAGEAKIVKLRGLAVPIASIAHLIRMKREAGRPKDLDDIDALERIARIEEGRDGT